MVRAVLLPTSIQTKDGSIIKATVDGNMVLLAGTTIFRATNELGLSPQARAALDTAIRQEVRKTVFDYGDGRVESVCP